MINSENYDKVPPIINTPSANGESIGSALSINVLSMLTIFVLCYICLFIVLICYGTILKTIREFQNASEKFKNESRKYTQSNSNLIYHKRSL